MVDNAPLRCAFEMFLDTPRAIQGHSLKSDGVISCHLTWNLNNGRISLSKAFISQRLESLYHLSVPLFHPFFGLYPHSFASFFLRSMIDWIVVRDEKHLHKSARDSKKNRVVLLSRSST
jgi:hypothetical protein